MARPRQFESNADRQKAYRERKAQDVDPELPVRDVDEPEPDSAERSVEVLLTLDPHTLLTDSEEQALRDHFGYTASERRTRAERAAGRITTGPPPPEVAQAIRTLRSAEAQYVQKRQEYLAALKPPVPSPSR